MTEIIEEAFVIFNHQQNASKPIAKTFKSAGQDPWADCEAEFKDHLDSLAKLHLYSNKNENALFDGPINNQTATVLAKEDNDVEMELEEEEEEVEEELEGGEDEAVTDEGVEAAVQVTLTIIFKN